MSVEVTMYYCRDCPMRNVKKPRIENASVNDFYFTQSDQLRKCQECHLKATQRHYDEEKRRMKPDPPDADAK